MVIKKAPVFRYSDITPKEVYMNRRRFLATGTAGIAAAWSLVHGAGSAEAAIAGGKLNVASKSPFSTDEKPTPYKDVTHYNNYYEFGTSKEQPADRAKYLQTSPWTVKVEGAVAKPQTIDIDALMKMAPLEERIY